jgi:hypothetical protein
MVMVSARADDGYRSHVRAYARAAPCPAIQSRALSVSELLKRLTRGLGTGFTLRIPKAGVSYANE